MPSAKDASLDPAKSFQGLILTLQTFWAARAASCCNPTTWRWARARFTRRRRCARLGRKPWKAAYVQPSRRPKDGRYGENPNRLQHYYQYQVILKP